METLKPRRPLAIVQLKTASLTECCGVLSAVRASKPDASDSKSFRGDIHGTQLRFKAKTPHRAYLHHVRAVTRRQKGPAMPTVAATDRCILPDGLQAIIFDCDGILVDSEGKHAESWVRSLRRHGIAFTTDDYRPYVGHDADFLARSIAPRYPGVLASDLSGDKCACYQSMQREGVTPIAPAVSFVRHLFAHKADLGVQIGLASTSSRVDIAANLAGASIAGGFDTVVSGRDDLDAYPSEGGRNKPKPYIYLEAARRLDVAPEHCLAFEDTPTGVEAAHAAGMRVFAVPNTWTAASDFSLADKVLASLEACVLTLDAAPR